MAAWYLGLVPSHDLRLSRVKVHHVCLVQKLLHGIIYEVGWMKEGAT
jgi:hypothetical protein